jgi:LTXXQ motif family protein
MTTIKAGLTGMAVGALIWATVMFVAPISAQAPGGQAPGGTPPSAGSPPAGDTGSRGGPGMMGRDTGPGAGRMGPGMMGRNGVDPNDPDITGPRGDAGFCAERLARMAQMRLERVQRLVRPTDEQRLAFEELRAAAAKGVEMARAACPTERPLTPPARMAAAERMAEARLQALKTVRPALESFYRVLSDEQKIRWANGLDRWGGWGDGERGRDDRDRWRDDRQDWSGPGRGRGWDDRYGDRGPYFERWRDRERDRWGGWREERGRDWDRFRGRGDDWGYRGRDDGRGGGERRSEQWRERFHDWQDRFGFDRGRGRDPDRWDQRWHDDERGSTGRGGRDERRRSPEPDEERL